MEEDIGTVEINSELYQNDLDEVGYEPETIDDSDESYAERFDY